MENLLDNGWVVIYEMPDLRDEAIGVKEEMSQMMRRRPGSEYFIRRAVCSQIATRHYFEFASEIRTFKNIKSDLWTQLH